MLIEFSFKNYRSFRDETVLSMEATRIGTFKGCLIAYNNMKLLPGAAILGKNGGGKSNVIRAFWLAVQFIKNAQRTQHEKAEVPVIPFALNDYSATEPTEFSFIYTLDNIKYWYSFAATRDKIFSESLYYAPKGQKAMVFSRKGQKFTFTADKVRRKLIGETVAKNQLYFSVACTMNDIVCSSAMKWFRDKVYFSRDYSDIPLQLLEYYSNPNMLKAITDYAKAADFGIEDMQFDINSNEIEADSVFPFTAPEGIKATALHFGLNRNGSNTRYSLELADESDGTRKFIALTPAIESVLSNGGILLIDGIEKNLHPMLVEYIVAKFQSKKTNPNGAQIVFTTHNTELLNMELLRKDQLYFTDKNKEDGVSKLYSISDFSTRTTENVRKGYLLGKYGATPNIKIEEML